MRIIQLEATVIVNNETEDGEIRLPFEEFLEHTLPEALEDSYGYRVDCSNVFCSFDI